MLGSLLIAIIIVAFGGNILWGLNREKMWRQNGFIARDEPGFLGLIWAQVFAILFLIAAFGGLSAVWGT